jgi:hypothetical protein
MASAAWLFVRAVARHTGDDGVASLADRAGAAFPVLDAVARGWLDGVREPRTDPGPVLQALGAVTRLVVVGIESILLDPLVLALDSSVKIATIAHSPFPVDWVRVLDNYGGRIEQVDLDTFQKWAGAKSALLTFAYGRQGSRRGRARAVPRARRVGCSRCPASPLPSLAGRGRDGIVHALRAPMNPERTL